MTHKILIVDAEAATVALVAAALHQAGYVVLTAEDGRQALAQDAAEQPDLVCVDIHLPAVDGLDGFEICRRLKAARPVPVVLTTSTLDDATSSGFARVGADDLLFKPYTPDEIIDKVAWYLEPEA